MQSSNINTILKLHGIDLKNGHFRLKFSNFSHKPHSQLFCGLRFTVSRQKKFSHTVSRLGLPTLYTIPPNYAKGCSAVLIRSMYFCILCCCIRFKGLEQVVSNSLQLDKIADRLRPKGNLLLGSPLSTVSRAAYEGPINIRRPMLTACNSLGKSWEQTDDVA